MNNTFYGPDENYYLEHHGIKNQKWGKRNGPPYPLSDAKHDRIVKRAEKRRQKIVKDPKKLYKHQSEFTTEELAAALEKIKVAKAVQREIPGKKKKQVKLKGRKKDWAKDPVTLSKHIDKYTKEEFELAKDEIYRREFLWDKKMKKYEKPKDVIDLTSRYLRSGANIVGNAKDLKDKITPYNPNKLTDKQKNALFLIKNGYSFMVDPKYLNLGGGKKGYNPNSQQAKDFNKLLEKYGIKINNDKKDKKDKYYDKKDKKDKYDNKKDNKNYSSTNTASNSPWGTKDVKNRETYYSYGTEGVGESIFSSKPIRDIKISDSPFEYSSDYSTISFSDSIPEEVSSTPIGIIQAYSEADLNEYLRGR